MRLLRGSGASRKRRLLVSWMVLAAFAAAAASSVVLAGLTATGARADSLDLGDLTTFQQRIVSGFVYTELSPPGQMSGAPRSFAPTGQRGCSSPGSNVKVNQNCLNLTDPSLQGRGQAQNETAIAQDPNRSTHLVATFNDYRRGDGTCGAAFSTDGGHNWNDVTTPNGFVDGTAFGAAREYYEAGGDPSVAFDSKGNAYYDCQMFSRGAGVTTSPDASSGVYVFRSTGNGGASWNFPGRPVVQASLVNGGSGGLPLEDKPYMTVDNHAGSSYQDRVYVTWTEFTADGTGYLWESYSSDYGETFSPRVLVSTTSPLCAETYGLATPQGTCNENQYSQPFTAPDGTLYVVFDNYNNTVSGSDNRNQILLVKSTDGGQSFSAPVKVADFYDLPDCATYQAGQDAGRACVPEKGPSTFSVFRAANYPVGSVNPTDPSQIAVTLGSYINAHSQESNGCTPAGFSPFGINLYTGVKTEGACNNGIVLSVSDDGGASFTGTTTDPRSLPLVTQDSGQTTSDQWWEWATFTDKGTLAVSYYDRQYGDDETTGASDVSVSSSKNLASFKTARATSSSMPPPTEFTDDQGNSLFYGDYSGLAALGGSAHPLWADTRSLDLFTGSVCGTSPPAVCTGIEPNGLTANDEDISTASVGVP
jgi:hypothetical protein